MRADDLVHAQWRKSSYSGANNGDCVEVADGIPGVIPVRDSKVPGRAIAFSAGEWSRFVSTLRRG
ncbi:DUF397 domain-containing protein [Streptomyces sp. PT12]|uniref:DUF397 domain-containing protein n=1 Tax=Streptomyces sp. PT12 TaxID=1510197 RepID=UPI000DE40A7D|nr:DUF397 domain-containing protein [Streptomyces sp. PT12]RBM18073.1 DUF397 domain-containing protein [Streptomyces sp. PT12]